MIHARKDYNRIQDDLIPKDEPVFLLRAQDDVAAQTVRVWALLHELKHGKSDIGKLAKGHAEKMKSWPKKKKADL